MTGRNSEKERARWRRNKQAERKRKAPVHAEPPPDLVAAVMAERNRRAAHRHGWAPYRWCMDDKAMAFLADVWAAKVLLEWQLGVGKATPTKIARKLTAQNLTHGYTASSLRVMIYRSRDRIGLLEGRLPSPYRQWEGWEPFDLEPWSAQL